MNSGERLLRSFEQAVTARIIAEEVHTCHLLDPLADAHARMDERGFDVLGVRDDRDVVVGWVHREATGPGSCSNHYVPFTATDLISDSTPVYELLAVLQHQPRVFMLAGPSVSAIITRADLQKEPIRVFVFALITMLEMAITVRLQASYEGEEWQARLSSGRIARARDLYQARLERNEEIALFDCLQFCDKRDLVAGAPELRAMLGFDSKSSCSKVLRGVEAIRDRVAHGQDLVAGTDWPETIELLESVDLMLQRNSS